MYTCVCVKTCTKGTEKVPRKLIANKKTITTMSY